MEDENKKEHKNKKLLSLMKLCKKFKKEEPIPIYDFNRDGKWLVKI